MYFPYVLYETSAHDFFLSYSFLQNEFDIFRYYFSLHLSTFHVSTVSGHLLTLQQRSFLLQTEKPQLSNIPCRSNNWGTKTNCQPPQQIQEFRCYRKRKTGWRYAYSSRHDPNGRKTLILFFTLPERF